MKRRKQNGFTLIEVLVAVVMTMIVILATGAILIAGHRSWNQAWKKVNLQRDASHAMLRLSRPIKLGTDATVQSDGAAITISGWEGGWTRFFLVPETNELQREIEGQDPETVIGEVADLSFVVENEEGKGNRVVIGIELVKDDLSMHLVSTVMMRNYGL